VNRRLPMLKLYEDLAACEECGGACCASSPGITRPEDLGAPDEAVMRATLLDRLRTGRWTLEMSGAQATVRPAMVGSEGAVLVEASPPGTFGPCTFWDRHGGCTIFSIRPTGCRVMEPILTYDGHSGFETHCVDHGVDLRDAWAPYHELLRSVVGELAGAGIVRALS
jgi:Fe-S-cluster containining protein